MKDFFKTIGQSAKETFSGTLSVKPALDWYNTIIGSIIAVLSAIFGQYWYLFAAFVLFNVLDWLTGWYKARKLEQESSAVGAKGAIKKLFYWIVVAVAFVISAVFAAIGKDLLGIDLSFMLLLGWFTLAGLTVNEARSILENLIEMGINVPKFLITGLAVTQKLIQAKADAALPADEEKK
ncbi:MAG: phage holin family protein [Oscillospiraceae bacterium]